MRVESREWESERERGEGKAREGERQAEERGERETQRMAFDMIFPLSYIAPEESEPAAC